MRSHSSSTSTNKLPKFLPLALSALITLAPLNYLANHSFKLDSKNPLLQQVVEMSLLEDLIKPIPRPKQLQQQVVPNTVLLPSSVIEPIQNTRIENSMTQAPLPPEVVEPKHWIWMRLIRREIQQVNQAHHPWSSWLKMNRPKRLKSKTRSLPVMSKNQQSPTAWKMITA